MPVAVVKLACVDVYAPWSQVIECPQLRRQRGDGLAHRRGFSRDRGAALLEVQQQDEAGGALDEGADRAPTALAQDEVAFLVVRHRAVGDLGGAFGDIEQCRGSGPGDRERLASCGRHAPGSQASSQIAAWFATTLHEQRPVDGLVTHPHSPSRPETPTVVSAGDQRSRNRRVPRGRVARRATCTASAGELLLVARRCAFHAESVSLPPFAATSRLTVDGERPEPARSRSGIRQRERRR